MVALIAALASIATPLISLGNSPAISSGPFTNSITAELTINQNTLPADRPRQPNSIPIILNESVENHIAFFTTTGKYTLMTWFRKSGPALNLTKELLRKEGLPEELAYVAMIESGYDNNALSPAQAVGPWQLMEETALEYGLRIDPWVDERRDIVKSTETAAAYLQDLFDRFNSWSLAVAAYNAGRGKIVRAVSRTDSLDFWDLKFSGSLRQETRQFVPKFMAVVLIARDPAVYGFAAPSDASLRYSEVTVPGRTDLRLVAHLAGATVKHIRSLNPHFLQGITPPGSDAQVRIPAGTYGRYKARLDALKKSALSQAVSKLSDIFPSWRDWYVFGIDDKTALAAQLSERLPLYGFVATLHNIRERRKRVGRKVSQQ